MYLKLLLFFTLAGHAVEAIMVTTSQKVVNVTRGSDALLHCFFNSTIQETRGLTILWEFISSGSSQQVYYYQGGQVVISAAYRGRLQPPVSPGATKNASIVIEDTRASDAGVYSCAVHNLPDVSGRTEATISLNILERPSKPYCSVHGDVESGHLVTLTCHSGRGSPAPSYTWTGPPDGPPAVSHASGAGVLEFRNISQFEFGEYRCNASNAAGWSTCTVELHPEAGHGVVAGAVVGALLGCVLIVLAVWFVAHTLKRKKYRAVKAEEGKEMEWSAARPQEAATATAAAPQRAEGEEPEA